VIQEYHGDGEGWQACCRPSPGDSEHSGRRRHVPTKNRGCL